MRFSLRYIKILNFLGEPAKHFTHTKNYTKNHIYDICGLCILKRFVSGYFNAKLNTNKKNRSISETKKETPIPEWTKKFQNISNKGKNVKMKGRILIDELRSENQTHNFQKSIWGPTFSFWFLRIYIQYGYRQWKDQSVAAFSCKTSWIS